MPSEIETAAMNLTREAIAGYSQLDIDWCGPAVIHIKTVNGMSKIDARLSYYADHCRAAVYASATANLMSYVLGVFEYSYADPAFPHNLFNVIQRAVDSVR